MECIFVILHIIICVCVQPCKVIGPSAASNNRMKGSESKGAQAGDQVNQGLLGLASLITTLD